GTAWIEGRSLVTTETLNPALWGTAPPAAAPPVGRPAPAPARTFTHTRLPLITTAAAIAVLPLTEPRGSGNLGPGDVLIVMSICTWVWSSAVSGRRLWFPYTLAAGLMIVGGALGALAGPVPSAGLLALAQDLLLLVWCWTVANVGSRPGHARVLFRAWAASSIVWAGVLLTGLLIGASALTGQVPKTGVRTTLTFGDPNVAANYFVISIMIVCATGYPRHRWLRVAAYVALVAALVSTGSNSGLVALAVCVSVAVILGVRRRVGLVPAIACLAAIILFAVPVVATTSIRAIQQRASTSSYAFVREGIGRGEQSVTERTTVLGESTHLYETGGILGAGPVSTKPRLIASMAPYPKEAHDDYFASLMERGVIGALGLMVLLASVLVRGGTLLRRDVSAGVGSALSRPHAVVAALIGTMITMTVFELLHVRHVWTLFALVAAASLWERE
ncbi:MAG TPA: O-antigen ligase family protein, partial [Gaiellales bacterium]|nr:O-antigen ligase family protein [Gaiellales bacterium]